MIAFATSAEESTSPMPTRPASVWTLTTRVSWLPSQRSLTLGRRRWIGSTRVIFMAEIVRQGGCGWAELLVTDREAGGEVGGAQKKVPPLALSASPSHRKRLAAERVV